MARSTPRSGALHRSIAVACASLAVAATFVACGAEVPIDNTVKSISMLASQAGTPPSYLEWGALDPNAVIVFVGGADLSCASPFVPDWHEGTECVGPDRREWRLAVVLPPGTQAGAFDLSNATSADVQQWIDDNQCAGGGGQLGGTVDVVSNDPKGVLMKFDGASIGKMEDMPDVATLLAGKTLQATRCP
jgi:hypothetical protein